MSVKSRIQEVSKELNTVQDELIKIVKKRKALEKLRDRWEDENKSYLGIHVKQGNGRYCNDKIY